MASNSDGANADSSPASSISPIDRDITIRTMIGEAGNQGLDGQAGIGSVMLNRLAAGTYGKTLSDIAFAKNQFEPWSSRSDELMAIDPSSQQYQQAAHVFDGLSSGAIPDITMGSTHFLAPSLQSQLGRAMPSWARGQGIPLGGHVFYAPNGPVAAKGGTDAMSAINGATGQNSQPPSSTLAYTSAPAAAPAPSMSDDDIDSLYVGAHKAGEVSPGPQAVPASQPVSASPPPKIAFGTQAPWETSADAMSPQGATPTSAMSDADIDAMYAGTKPNAPAPAPVITKDGVRDPKTGELVVGGKGFTPDSSVWSGVRNMANGALLGAGVPLEAATAALKEKYWNGSPLSLGNLYDQAHDTYAGGRQSYQAQHPVAAAVTEGAGNLLTTIPATMAGGAVLGAAGGAALDGMQSLPMLSRLAPAAEGVGDFVSGNSTSNLFTTLGSRGVAGAAQGAAAGAMSTGLGDQSIGDAARQGAEFGGALGAGIPAIFGGAKYAKNALTSLSEPFTEGGTSRLAQAPLQNTVGNISPSGNLNELITGSRPTFAEAYPDANAATIQRTARDLNPQPFVAREAANNAARNAHLANLTGSPQDVEAAEAALDTNAHNAISTLFKPGQVANAQPVVDTIDGILNGSGGKRDAVRAVMTNIRSKLVDSDGSIENDPQTLYDSVRKQIGDLLDKRATTSDPAGQQASRELMQVRDSLDGAITEAVPGFDQYLSNYSAAKRPIDAMKFMQGLNLTDTQGNTTLSKVDSALKNIAKLRMADGSNAAKSLTDDHIDGLSALRDDLLRQTNIGLGRSAGSPTAQNLATQNMLNTILPGKAGAFVGGVARPEVIGGGVGTFLGHHLGGYYGAAAGGGIGAGLGRMASTAMQERGAIVRSKLDNLLLDPGSYTPAPTGSGGQYLPLQGLPGGVVPMGLTLRNELLQSSSQ